MRGEKATPWQGGTRVVAFLAGGWLPTSLQGTTNDAVMHVADVCKLATYTTANCIIIQIEFIDPFHRNLYIYIYIPIWIYFYGLSTNASYTTSKQS